MIRRELGGPDRFADLRKFSLPALDAAAAAGLMRWAMAGIVLAVFVWTVDGKIRRRLGDPMTRYDGSRHTPK